MLALLLKNASFRRLAIAQWVSFCGDWFNLIAIVTLLGPEKTESAFVLALALVLKQIPVVALTPLAGVFADKFDRKRIMIGCDLLRAILVLVLIAVVPTQATILTIVTLMTVVVAFFDPARTASIPQLVEIEDLRAANSLAAMFFPLGLLCGSALGGIITVYGGVNFALLLDAMSFMISALFLWRLPSLPPFESAGGQRVKVSYREFFRTKLPTREHWLAITSKGLFGLGGAAYLVQVTISSRLEIGASGTVGLSAMLAARALGAFSGGIISSRLFGEGEEVRGIRLGFFATSLSYCVAASTERLELFLPAIFIGHMGSCFIWVFSSLWTHRLFSNRDRGRAFGADFAFNMLAASTSTLLAGYAIKEGMITDRGVALMCGLLWCGIGLAYLTYRPRAGRGVEARAQESPAA